MTSRLLAIIAMSSLAACAGRTGAKGNDTGSGGTGGPAIRCSNDQQCGKNACVGGTCKPRVGALPTWAIEVRPLGNGTTAMITERISIDEPGDVEADRSVGATITFVGTNMNPVPATANVLLSVPSAIPGRDPLTFETDLLASGATTLTVPEGVLSRATTVWLTPTSLANQQNPPVSFPIPPQTSNNLRLTMPDGGPWIHGTLHDALDAVPLNSYVARAYQQERLVSNIATIMHRSPSNQLPAADGGFSLTVPAAIASSPIVIQLSPTMPANDPWFTHDPLTLMVNMPAGNNLELGIIRLPDYQMPQSFNVEVQDGASGQAVTLPKVLLRAMTQLAPQADGITRFLGDGLTNAQGVASLSLIPGMAGAPRAYQVAVVPPAGAPFASDCRTESVAASGTTQLVPLPLFPRPRLTGTVVDAGDLPVAGVTVTASRDPLNARVCEGVAIGPTTTMTTTNAAGWFSLPLDADEHYQLDYDPPAGAAVPRHTEYEIDVRADVDRQVRLPAAAVIEGTVRDADGAPLQYATVRIFEPRCDAAGCKPPQLRGETLADGDGHYRVLVAMPGAN